MIGEVARAKALAVVLGKAKVTDSKGKAVDLAEFTAAFEADEDDENSFDPSAQVELGSDDHSGHDHGAKDSHGRSKNHEHYGHDHK